MWQFTRKSKYTVINVQFTKYFHILLFLFWYGSHVCFVPWYSQLLRSSSHWTALLSSWVSQSYNRTEYIVTSCYISQVARGGFRGGRTRRAPPLFFAEKGRLTLCGRPRQKECTKIVQIDFENCNFSLLLRGHIPLRHPLSPQVPNFCQSLT